MAWLLKDGSLEAILECLLNTAEPRYTILLDLSICWPVDRGGRWQSSLFCALGGFSGPHRAGPDLSIPGKEPAPF